MACCRTVDTEIHLDTAKLYLDDRLLAWPPRRPQLIQSDLFTTNGKLIPSPEVYINKKVFINVR